MSSNLYDLNRKPCYRLDTNSEAQCLPFFAMLNQVEPNTTLYWGNGEGEVSVINDTLTGSVDTQRMHVP